jgi:hypothetical protein
MNQIIVTFGSLQFLGSLFYRKASQSLTTSFQIILLVPKQRLDFHDAPTSTQNGKIIFIVSDTSELCRTNTSGAQSG